MVAASQSLRPELPAENVGSAAVDELHGCTIEAEGKECLPNAIGRQTTVEDYDFKE